MELAEWFEFYRLEPFGESWQQAAMLAALLHNAHFAGPAKRPDDFLPVQPEKAPQADFLYFQAFAAQHNAALALRGT